ncbi:polyketide synthase [Pedobacter duraquae]|uniref:Amino acid adenylation domain-containing protein n=1 Tax=Pedobacter duraquae TaxID=425511 RepID=A0A4R6IDE4_9SPHI|nr:polyketide synthase [Pedobacter duraquae]TDO19558.1 amino acid adenylation domain-containing protein [Pedobacter duraquae]
MMSSKPNETGNNIYSMFSKQAKQTPELTAVSFKHTQLTYGQLENRVTLLSAQIIASDHSDLIGISTTRGLDMLVALLAILKSGKAYLPLDPLYPQSRLKEIIGDSGIKTILCPKEENQLFIALGIKTLTDSASDTPFLPGNSRLAYVLYTSGSTGKPKGVCMGQRALVNLITWQQEHSSATHQTKTLQFAPLSFDVSFQEIFATLSTGGEIILIDDDLRLDPLALLHFIEEENINRIFVPFVALQLLAETAVTHQIYPESLQEIMTAGEQLKITAQVRQFFEHLPQCMLYNQYGPTECHVVTELKLDGAAAEWPALPSIGSAITNTAIYILDENLNLLPSGQIGELCIAGNCLAEGYLHQSELTAQKFPLWHHPTLGQTRIYRTGDQAKISVDGEVTFLGRNDDQVKIRGYRIELAEIEVIINQLPAVQDAVVTTREDLPGNKKLVAYLRSANTEENTAKLRSELSSMIPEYMVPANFVWLKEFPKTSSGKVDKKALPRPELGRSELENPFIIPGSRLEQTMASIWEDLLQVKPVGVGDNFFELGGNSLLAQKTILAFKQQDILVPITKLYQYPTIFGIVAFLSGDARDAAPKPKVSHRRSSHNGDIAIVGMSGRFPEAETIAEFWDLLREGRDTIHFFSKDELDPSIPEGIKNDPGYIPARGILSDVTLFDADFWQINPKQAELMDPQQRIFLEISRDVLEATGHLPSNYNGTIGIHAGSGSNGYFLNNVWPHQDAVQQAGKIMVDTFNEKDYLSSRTAYQLNLKGPAVSVNSACSTSALAIAQAVESLRSGQCNLAIAGGASITVPVNSGQIHQEGAMFSSDGHCRPFDAAASGTLFSDGVAVVLLKNLDDAIADGDTIYALIKGIGVNNDGGQKSSFTAPDALGQAGAITMALQDAEVEPGQISYVEAHGTATPLGDPIEIEGLQLAYGQHVGRQYCAIGSLKSNIGHLTHAAGVAGIIKTALSLYHKQLPASLHYHNPNPHIDFENSPFYVNDRLSDWDSDSPRFAGVSSFGVGGTNVHLILESYENPRVFPAAQPAAALVCWSAKSVTSLNLYAEKLKDFLIKNPDTNLANLAYTLQTTRNAFKHRQWLVATDHHDLLKQLGAATTIQDTVGNSADIAFLFPGQGAQHADMGKGLYANEPVFRAAIDEGAAILQRFLAQDIRSVLYDAEDPDQINNTYYTQPAIFITEYALAKLWMSWGIMPEVLIGHSIGEFVAAHLAGIFSLEDVLKLIAARGRLISELPKGTMISVRAAAAELRELPDTISIAAINAPELCVLAGSIDDIAAYTSVLDQHGILYKPLHTSHAFHSLMMDNAIDPFREIIKTIQLNVPKKPIISTVTGQWLTDAEALDPEYWTMHMRATVNFQAAIEFAKQQQTYLMLEVGPGKGLATLAFQMHAKNSSPARIIPGLTPSILPVEDYISLLKALGKLWSWGANPNWESVYTTSQKHRINLPTYAYDKKRHWLEAPLSTPSFTIQADHAFAHFNPIPTKMTATLRPRKDLLTDKIKDILENASGINIDDHELQTSFIALGLDSLLLTQIAITIKREFKLPVSFKQLNDEYTSVALLAAFLDTNLPADVFQDKNLDQTINSVDIPEAPGMMNAQRPQGSPLDEIIRQLGDLTRQVASLQNGTPLPAPSASPLVAPELTEAEIKVLKSPFGAAARIEKQSAVLQAGQQEFLSGLTKRYNAKTAKSKAYTQENRAHMADPRVVSGFKPATKELVYSLVMKKSKGCRLWDLDGNEYIDALNGFGSSMLGFQPDFLKEAVLEQVEKGYEIGPQHELAGEMSRLICELTNFDRAALCNTGSEAVLGAMRISRTVTGRSLIVAFSGSYHGINDEVIIRGSKKLKSFPAAPGITSEAVGNMLILDYGTEESLQIIRSRAHELAAVLVEPVQSRRPEFTPIAFLKEIREITLASETVLIFDEVITGFRAHQGGAQAIFGIKADLGTYGKVIGGGMPIGAIAGKREFMDALDGGFWSYGDDSVPEAGVTYFAGTFVRHPLALAAGVATLKYMKTKGPALQEGLNSLTTYLANELNTICRTLSLPIYPVNFASLWKLKFHEEYPYSELLFTLMREKGIHIWDGFPCFVTEAHTRGDIDSIVNAFLESITALREVEMVPFYTQVHPDSQTPVTGFEFSPQPGARLGKDASGNPAWFIEDPEHAGKFMQLVKTENIKNA